MLSGEVDKVSVAVLMAVPEVVVAATLRTRHQKPCVVRRVVVVLI